MYRQVKSSVIILSLILTLSVTTHAAGQARMWLAVESPQVTVGRSVTVEILVKDVPLVYGADVRLIFDPHVLQAIDADGGIAGVQIEPGDFLDTNRAIVLQHHVDNQNGSVDYALALLNPAPPVQGDGLLARVTFQTIADGQTTIRIENGMFGTQSGETIAPIVENADISIAATTGDDLKASKPPMNRDTVVVEVPENTNQTQDKAAVGPETEASAHLNTSSATLRNIVILALVTLAGAGLMGGSVWLQRVRKR